MSELLFALRWYLVLQLFSLAALPLTLRLFRHLPGRGYAFARPLALLTTGWFFWLALTLDWLPNTTGAVLVALALLAIGGMVLWLGANRFESFSLKTLWGTAEDSALDWRHVLAVEAVLAAAFVAWCLVRAHMPRIETSGGEKWMEIAFLNAILRAPRFPPHDPWLSGFAISYYYLGYVIVSMLVRLAAVPSTIGFNLAVATLFALACSGAYGLVYSLLAGRGQRAATWGALLGPLLVAVSGNLEGLLEVLHARGLFPASFWQWLDIRSLNVAPPPLAEGSWLPTRFIWWWQASRVLTDTAPWHSAESPAIWEVIDEFPGFSFLLGDMHPHVLALPFVLLVLALALALFFRSKIPDSPLPVSQPRFSLSLAPWEVFVYALCLGALGFLNTWDLPIYLFVVSAAFIYNEFRHSSFAIRPSHIIFPLLLTVGGVVLYLPFWIGLRSQASGIAPNLFNGTRLPQFLVMFGPLLLPLGTLLLRTARRQGVRARDVAAWALTILFGMLIFLALAALITPQGREYLLAWRSGGTIPGLEHVPNAAQSIVDRLLQRLLAPWTALLLAAGVVLAVLALFAGFQFQVPGSRSQPAARSLSPETAFALLLLGTGALLTLGVEFVYLRDNFGTRMNTVFKFYFETWVMWAVVAAFELAQILAHRRWWAVLPVVVLLGGLVYPALAIPTRAREYGGQPTLDGAAHLYEFQAADFDAIDWLNETVDGAPVILEAPGDGFRAYVYEGRVSAFTGLPTLLGWGGHQHQWRGNYDEPGRREPDIETIYSTTDPSLALTLLQQYGISYVYVGPVETARYPVEGLAKFVDVLDVVYDANGVTIYRYTPASAEAAIDGQFPEP